MNECVHSICMYTAHILHVSCSRDVTMCLAGPCDHLSLTGPAFSAAILKDPSRFEDCDNRLFCLQQALIAGVKLSIRFHCHVCSLALCLLLLALRVCECEDVVCIFYS